MHGVIYDLMSVIFSTVRCTTQRIGVERRARFHMLVDFSLQALFLRFGTTMVRPSATLQDAHDRGLIFAARSSDAALALR